MDEQSHTLQTMMQLIIHVLSVTGGKRVPNWKFSQNTPVETFSTHDLSHGL